jgi:putative transposase
MPDRIPPLE